MIGQAHYYSACLLPRTTLSIESPLGGGILLGGKIYLIPSLFYC